MLCVCVCVCVYARIRVHVVSGGRRQGKSLNKGRKSQVGHSIKYASVWPKYALGVRESETNVYISNLGERV